MPTSMFSSEAGHGGPDAAEAAASCQPSQVLLKMGPKSEVPEVVDRAVHLSLVRELLGEEVREIIRSELRGARGDPLEERREIIQPEMLGAVARRGPHDQSCAGKLGLPVPQELPNRQRKASLCSDLPMIDDDALSSPRLGSPRAVKFDDSDDDDDDKVRREIIQSEMLGAFARRGPHDSRHAPQPPKQELLNRNRSKKETLPSVNSDDESLEPVSPRPESSGASKPDDDDHSPKAPQMGSRPPRFTTRSQSKEISSMFQKGMRMQMTRINSQASSRGFTGSLPSLQHQLEMLSLWWEEFRGTEPTGNGCLIRIVQSRTFDAVMMTTILINCIFMIHVADEEIANYDAIIPTYIMAAEAAFLCIYTIEIGLKIIAQRRYFFLGADGLLNSFDLSLVFSSALSLADSLASQSGFLPSTSTLRILRVFKLLKVLRIVKMVSHFRRLRAMLISLAKSFTTLLWSMLMLTLFLYMFSLLFVQQVASFFRHGGKPDEHQDLADGFSSVLQSILTLFAATSGGISWLEVYNYLAPCGIFCKMLFVFNIIFIQVALVNIILGMFVETAMKSMQGDKEQNALEHADEENKNEADLLRICKDADLNGDGRLSMQQWLDTFDESNSHSYLELMGIRFHDAMEYFSMLGHLSKDGEVDIETFAAGCMRLKGTASCFETRALRVELATLQAYLKRHLQDPIKKEAPPTMAAMAGC